MTLWKATGSSLCRGSSRADWERDKMAGVSPWLQKHLLGLQTAGNVLVDDCFKRNSLTRVSTFLLQDFSQVPGYTKAIIRGVKSVSALVALSVSFNVKHYCCKKSRPFLEIFL